MAGLLRVLAAVVGVLPWRALAALGALLGWVAGDVLRIRRNHVEDGMRVALVHDPAREASAMYASLGASAMEFLWLSSRGEQATRHVAVEHESRARWRSALSVGRGVVIAASHTGNWDLAACAIARDVELLVVTKRLSVQPLDRFWQSTRARRGVALAEARGAIAHAGGVLRRGGAVAMMIDQVPVSPRHAVEIAFLGRPALADRAPAALAAARRAPLVVAASQRDSTGEHVLHVLDVLVPPDRPGRAWIEQATVSAARALERFVRAHPDQWLWLHRRWRMPSAPLDRGPRPSTLAAPWRTIRSSSPDVASKAG